MIASLIQAMRHLFRTAGRRSPSDRAGSRLAALALAVRRDEAGFVLVFLAVALPALIGLVGLAVDGTRLMTLDTELAGLADAAALAAAGRLDRSDEAIAKARDAADAVVAGASLGASGPAAPRLSFRFAASLSDLQDSPSFTLSEAAASEAVYVEVRTADVSLTTSFLQLVGARASPLQRRAVAESQYLACDVTPALLCQPRPDVFVATARPGRQYLLRMDGNRLPGSIALLDRRDAVNTRQVLRNLASNAPQFCYGDGVRLRTNITPTEFDEAVNVRFDRYVTRTGPVAPDLAVYPPAPNVISGRHLNACTSLPQGGDINPPYALPRDTAYQGYRLIGPWDAGQGDWNVAPALGGSGASVRTALDEYIAWNHGDKAPDVQARLRASPTRFGLYLRELGLTRQTETTPVNTRGYGPSNGTLPTGGPLSGPFSARRENAVPVCYAGGLPATDARRRILYLAVADCGQFPAAATAINLSRRVAKFFMTEPSDLGATLLEFVNMVQPTDDDGKLRHVVQLVDTN